MGEQILVSFVAKQDPWKLKRGESTPTQEPGPILSLLNAWAEKKKKPFSKAVFFFTKDLKDAANKLASEVKKVSPETLVKLEEVNISDLTDYNQIITAIRPVLGNVDYFPSNSPLPVYIGIASGTPQMHACWMLLASSGEFPARVLHVREKKFTRSNQPLITEVNPQQVISSVPKGIVLKKTRSITDKEKKEAIASVGLIGNDPLFTSAVDQAVLAASSDQPVLILGESGTGKELFARFIHELSPHKEMQIVNTTSFNETLVESEFFGHKKHAFTGATNDRKGIFEIADNGSLFLDEIGEMSLKAQATLLRFLQEGEIRPIGSNETKKVKVRIIAATNKNLVKAISAKEFRRDLFYRINGTIIKLPSLNEHPNDIPILAMHFLNKFKEKNNPKVFFEQEALSFLQGVIWEGNVRELKNVILNVSHEVSEKFNNPPKITVNRLKKTLQHQKEISPQDYSQLPLPKLHKDFKLEAFITETVKPHFYARALEMSGDVGSKAAKMLGVSDATISQWKKKRSSTSVQDSEE